MQMKIIVVGCGRLGAGLAHRLFKQGHQVVIVDENDSAFVHLPADFRGRTITGDALNSGVLESAGIVDADGLAAVTNSDTVNAVVAHLAKEFFNVTNIVSRNYDPYLFPIHESFGLQTVSSAVWAAQRIEEMLYHGNVYTIFSAGNGEVEIYEINVPDDWSGGKLGELINENECVPIALTRAGKAVIPNCDTILQNGDIIQVGATLEGALTIRKRLSHREGK
jgi:trk system potassium uptake protein